MRTSASGSDFESLYSEHFVHVRRFVGQFVGDTRIADELAQDTFLRAYMSLGSYRGEASERTWLFRIARNLCLDYLRSPRARSSRDASLDQALTADREPAAYAFTVAGRDVPRSVEDLARQAEMSLCVQEFLAGLPESLRTPLVLHDAEELTNPEIASVLGCSLEAVKMRLHRARARLRDMMEMRCDLFHDDRNVLACAPGGLSGGCPSEGSPA